MSFKKDLEHLINRHSMESRSDTPDFILAQFLQSCLLAFETATSDRDQWRTGDVPMKTQISEDISRR